jgi:hypothetical protein
MTVRVSFERGGKYQGIDFMILKIFVAKKFGENIGVLYKILLLCEKFRS